MNRHPRREAFDGFRRGATPPARTSLTTTSWGFDFWRMLGLGLFAAIVMTVVLWLSANGGVWNSSMTKMATASGVFAGILTGLGPLLLPVFLHSSSRSDAGFRRSGLVSLMLLGALGVTVVQMGVMLVWPPIIRGYSSAGTIAEEYGRDGASTLTVGAFVLAAVLIFLATLLLVLVGFSELTSRWGLVPTMSLLLPFLGAVFLFGLQGARIFDRPAAQTNLWPWLCAVVIGAVGLVLVSLWCMRVGRRNEVTHRAVMTEDPQGPGPQRPGRQWPDPRRPGPQQPSQQWPDQPQPDPRRPDPRRPDQWGGGQQR